jgi:hypothetical protein
LIRPKAFFVLNAPHPIGSFVVKQHAFMSPFDIAFHLLNFFAPAVAVSVLLVLLTRIFMRKRPVAQRFIAQAAINSVAGCFTLAVGLAYFGNDGKMATYAALVLVCGTCQWVLLKGWR